MRGFIEFVGGLIATVGTFAFFIGLIMLWIAFKKNKPKKNLGIVTGIGFVLMLIGGSILPPIEEEQAKVQTVTKEENAEKQEMVDAEKKEQQAADKAQLDKVMKEYEEEEKKIAKKKQAEKEAEKNLPIDKKLVKNNDHVDEAAIDDKGFLTISQNATAAWSENSIVTIHTYWMFEAMNEGFKDPSVNEVEASIKTNVIDNKGNSSLKEVASFLYARETFEELNYEGFLTLASGQEWRIYNESDVYQLYPVIFNNIKEDYKDNLVSGISKYPLVTD